MYKLINCPFGRSPEERVYRRLDKKKKRHVKFICSLELLFDMRWEMHVGIKKKDLFMCLGLGVHMKIA